MKYLCLVYIQENQLEGMSKSDFDAGMAECLAYGEGLRRSGHYITSAALQTTQTATTVRVRNGKLSATDGPFAETKEQLGGFYLIDARDLNDAIQVVSKMPPARYGSIEVGPIREIDPRKAHHRAAIRGDTRRRRQRRSMLSTASLCGPATQ